MNNLVLGFLWWGKDSTEAKDAAKFLLQHADILHYQDFFGFALSSIKWGFIKFFYWIADSLFNIIPKAFDVKGILQAAGLTSLQSEIIRGGVAVALLGLTLTWVFMKKSLFPEASADTKKIVTNLLISAALIFGIGQIVDKGFEISQNVFNAATSSKTNSVPMKIIKDNTVDLYAAADNGWPAKDKATNSLDKDNLSQTDLTEVITKDKIDDMGTNDDSAKKELTPLKYQLTTDDKGKTTATKIESSGLMSKIYKPGYARFSVSGTVVIIGEICIAIAALFMIYTIISTIFQLAIAQIVALFVFSTDLESGQRTKAVLVDISKTIMVIAATGVEFYFYTVGLTYIAGAVSNPLIYVVALIALTMILLVGSNAFLKYFGVDTALKNNGNGLLKSMAFTTMALRGGGAAVQQVGSAAGNLNSIRKSAVDYASQHGLNKSAIGNGTNKLASAAGYLGSRKAGILNDAVNKGRSAVGAGVDKVKDGFNDKIVDPIKGVGDSYAVGQAAGDLANAEELTTVNPTTINQDGGTNEGNKQGDTTNIGGTTNVGNSTGTSDGTNETHLTDNKGNTTTSPTNVNTRNTNDGSINTSNVNGGQESNINTENRPITNMDQSTTTNPIHTNDETHQEISSIDSSSNHNSVNQEQTAIQDSGLNRNEGSVTSNGGSQDQQGITESGSTANHSQASNTPRINATERSIGSNQVNTGSTGSRASATGNKISNNTTINKSEVLANQSNETAGSKANQNSSGKSTQVVTNNIQVESKSSATQIASSRAKFYQMLDQNNKE